MNKNSNIQRTETSAIMPTGMSLLGKANKYHQEGDEDDIDEEVHIADLYI